MVMGMGKTVPGNTDGFGSRISRSRFQLATIDLAVVELEDLRVVPVVGAEHRAGVVGFVEAFHQRSLDVQSPFISGSVADHCWCQLQWVTKKDDSLYRRKGHCNHVVSLQTLP
jgi:hypothetical protein